MRRKAALLASIMLLVPAAALGKGGPPPPQFPRLPGQWSHAEINVTIKRVPHTLTLDRGRITQVSSGQLTLRERDGSIVVVPLNQQTLVVVDGLAGVPADLAKKMDAETMRIDNGPAVRVRATSR